MDALEELCAVAHAELGVDIEAIQSKDAIVLMEIERTAGKPGSGRVALERLCAYADEVGLPVTLAVSDYERKLVELYAGLGFEVEEPVNEEECGLYMTRRPGGPLAEAAPPGP